MSWGVVTTIIRKKKKKRNICHQTIELLQNNAHQRCKVNIITSGVHYIYYNSIAHHHSLLKFYILNNIFWHMYLYHSLSNLVTEEVDLFFTVSVLPLLCRYIEGSTTIGFLWALWQWHFDLYRFWVQPVPLSSDKA